MKRRTADETVVGRAGRLVAHRKAGNSLDGLWLTAEQIAASGALGPGKTVNAVRLYIRYHGLSDHPTWCRKAAGRGTTLEYNMRLFLPREVALRKVGRRNEANPPRELNPYKAAEGGEFFSEIYARVTLARMMGHQIESAEAIRNRCLERFGKTIMRANDADDRIEMPSLRVFRKIITRMQNLDTPPKVDRELLSEMAGLSGRTEKELIEIIKRERKARGQMIAEARKLIKGAKATRDPDALRRRIDRIEQLITGREEGCP